MICSPNSQWVLKFCDAIEKRGLKFNWGYKTTIAGTTREQIRRCQETGCTKLKTLVLNLPTMRDSMCGASTATQTMYTECSDGVEEEGVRSVAYIMLAGPHEKTMDEAIQIWMKCLNLTQTMLCLLSFHPYPGTDSFAEGAKKKSLQLTAGTG